MKLREQWFYNQMGRSRQRIGRENIESKRTSTDMLPIKAPGRKLSLARNQFRTQLVLPSRSV